MINKGTVSAVNKPYARVIPCDSGALTTWLRIPSRLIRSIEKGTNVIYVMFGDGTGMIFEREDGEYPDLEAMRNG